MNCVGGRFFLLVFGGVFFFLVGVFWGWVFLVGFFLVAGEMFVSND